MNRERILVVEDKETILRKRAELLRAEGYEVFEASNLNQALATFREHQIPVVVTDLKMDGGDGLEVAKQVNALRPLTMVIIITGAEREGNFLRSLQINTFAYLEKGHHTVEELRGAVAAAIESYRQSEEDRKRREIELQTKKSMLAFLTHTMRGTFAGAPAALEAALEHSKDLADQLANPSAYRAISKLASLHTAFRLIDSMLDAYKILVQDPERLRKGWECDTAGGYPLTSLVEEVLRSVLGRLLFSESQMRPFDRLAGGLEERKEIKRSYLQQVLLTSEPQPPSEWVRESFPIIEIGDLPPLQLDRDGIRYALLYSVLSELLFNAVKYTNATTPIRLEGSANGNALQLTCINPTDSNASKTRGSRKGLNFVQSILDPIPSLHLNLNLPGSGGACEGVEFRATLNFPTTN
ncbi:MAG: response regulator [bacterium]|nr:response regulator [bacterium]